MASTGTRILDRFIFSCFGSPENFIRDPWGQGYLPRPIPMIKAAAIDAQPNIARRSNFLNVLFVLCKNAGKQGNNYCDDSQNYKHRDEQLIPESIGMEQAFIVILVNLVVLVHADNTIQ